MACPRSGPLPNSAASWLRLRAVAPLPLHNLFASRRQCRLRLTQLEPRVNSGVVAILCQVEDLLTLREGRLRDVQLQVGTFELNVRMGNVRRQREPRRPRIQRTRTGLADRLL